MRYIKLFESFEDIHSICKKYGIENYTINSDGSIDVDGYVNLHSRGLTKFQLKFRNVSGDFYYHNNQITSFEGCPQYIGGDFYCSNNQMTSFEGCPKHISGNFWCHNNQITSFEGCPQHIGGDFNCGDPLYEVWDLFEDYYKLEFFNDCDIIRDDKVIILDRLNYFLEEIGKPTVKKVKGYKCI